ncbi:MAG TPA: hypothetical protein EYN74_06445 [Nitrospirales bacterium]|nr:hypothetical protein [Nitrospirales bacterium]HIN33643.1 hypothetical protein [Nitrospirales bacterium]
MSLQWLGIVLSYGVFFFLVLQTIDSRRKIDITVYAVIAIGCIEAVVGNIQSLFLEFGRAKGSFFNPNFLAVYLTAISALVLGMLTTSRYGWRVRIILGTVFLIMVCAVLLTGSRGGWLAFLMAIGCVLWLRFGKVAIAVVLAVVLLLAIVPNPLQQRVLGEHEHNPYTYSRMQIWSSSFSRALDHPLGTGLGIYKYTSQQHPILIEGVLSRYGTRAQTAHSEYLQIAVELGIGGLLVFFWGMSRMGRAVYAALTTEQLVEERSMLIGLTGGMCGLLTHAAVDSSFHQPPVVMLLILFGGIIVTMQRMGCGEDKIAVFAVRPTALTVCGIYVLATLISVVAIRPALAWYAWVDAERLLHTRHVEASYARLDWAIFLDPGNATYHDVHAQAAFQQLHASGDWAWGHQALARINYAASLNSIDERYRSHRGRIYSAMADVAGENELRRWALENARTSYGEAIHRDPYSPRHYLERARTHVALEDTRASQTDLLQAIELEPNYLPARFALGRLYQQLGQREEAVTEYQEIIERMAKYHGQTLLPHEKLFLNVDLEYVHAALVLLSEP